MSLQDQKMTTRIEEHIEDLWVKLEEKLMGWDERMIALRADFDMGALRKFIETKANKDRVTDDYQNHEFKIQALDRNIVAIAHDFETFQVAINKMHHTMTEIQDANKDVLIGKRNTNCLSCGIKDG